MPAVQDAPPQVTSLFHAEAMETATFLMSTQGHGCWLAQHDETGSECEGKLEAFHYVGRQRVRNSLRGKMPTESACIPCAGTGEMEVEVGDNLTVEPCVTCGGTGRIRLALPELIMLAEWDPRNAGPGCEGHHRRLDVHRMPRLMVAYEDLPPQVIEFARDWGLETSLEDKYERKR